MKQYHDLLHHVLGEGIRKEDRTGVGTISTFGYQMRFDLQKGFPLLTTKKVNFRLIASELLWFMRGDTNIRYLLENNNNIWNEWAFKKWIMSEAYQGPMTEDFGLRAEKDPDFKKLYQEEMNRFKRLILEDDDFAKVFGDLGNVYGRQWRKWVGEDGSIVDQLKTVIQEIKTNPDSRRLIVNAWHPTYIWKREDGTEHPDKMALPPCHLLFQFYVADEKLSCQLYQRSGDIFLGVPFNIASYSLLTHLVAHEAGLEVGEFVHTIGDAHIYTNHLEQVKTQLEREFYELPNIVLNKEVERAMDFELDDIQLVNYKHHPPIKAPVAV